MPLMTCVDCNSQHSTEAAACPTCGRPKEILSKVSDDGPVVMFDGYSVSAGQASRAEFIYGFRGGLFTMGLMILSVPIHIWVNKRIDSPRTIGILCGSGIWIVLWIIAKIEGY